MMMGILLCTPLCKTAIAQARGFSQLTNSGNCEAQINSISAKIDLLLDKLGQLEVQIAGMEESQFMQSGASGKSENMGDSTQVQSCTKANLNLLPVGSQCKIYKTELGEGEGAFITNEPPVIWKKTSGGWKAPSGIIWSSPSKDKLNFDDATVYCENMDQFLPSEDDIGQTLINSGHHVIDQFTEHNLWTSTPAPSPFADTKQFCVTPTSTSLSGSYCDHKELRHVRCIFLSDD